MRESADFDQLTVPGSYTRCGLKLELGDSWDRLYQIFCAFFFIFYCLDRVWFSLSHCLLLNENDFVGRPGLNS